MSTVTITAAEINKLRQATGAGMLDCRKALTETNGDFEGAIDWLRKQGQKVAAKRSDREAKEGVIIAKTSADNKTGFVVCISCDICSGFEIEHVSLRFRNLGSARRFHGHYGLQNG